MTNLEKSQVDYQASQAQIVNTQIEFMNETRTDFQTQGAKYKTQIHK